MNLPCTPSTVGAPPHPAVSRPLLSRRAQAGIAASAALALAGLTLLVAFGTTAAWDTLVLGQLHARAGTPTAMVALAVTRLGDGWPLIGALTSLGLLTRIVLSTPWRTVWLPLIAVALASPVGAMLKLALGRPRPPQSGWLGAAAGYAFPSGHTTAATAGYFTLALVTAGLLTSGRSRLLVCLAGVAVAGLVGWSRIALGVHWPSDVLGGGLLGTSVAGAVSAWFAGRTPVSGPAATGLPAPTHMSS